MKLVLYSNPDNGVLQRLESYIFPKNMRIVFGYMPADGHNSKPQYTEFWQRMALKHNGEFIYIDNSRIPNKSQLNEIMGITSLAVMGGNVFALLHNLRANGFDKIIRKLSKKDGFVYSGFSAGAMVVTPDVRIADKEFGWGFGYDDNKVGTKDTKALGLVDFEILPHYNPQKDKLKLEKYQRDFNVEVKPLTDSKYIIMKK